MAIHVAAAAMGESRDCAHTVAQLRQLAGDSSFPARWRENSMSDGKPLEVSISEGQDALFLQFVKTREGLWGEGAATICVSGRGLEAQLQTTHFRLGPAAHWILRNAFDRGTSLTLSWPSAGRMRIATPGWSGTFVAAPD